MQSIKLVFAALAGAALAAFSLLLWGMRADPSEGLEHQAAAQHQARMQPPVGASIPSPASASRTITPIRPADLEAHRQEKAIQQQKAMVMLDDRLRQQSIDYKWAKEQEAAIMSAIVGMPNDGFDVIEPDNVQTDCRTDLCRVRMDFSDEMMAAQMQIKFTMGLRGPIATARTFFVNRPDGGMDLVIYAGRNDRLF